MRSAWGRVAELSAAGRKASRRHAPSSPAAAVAVVAVVMVAVTVLRWFFDGAGGAVGLLYVLPIALAGLRFGRRGGLAAAGFGAAAFAGLELVRSGGDVDLTGWVAPLLAIVLTGSFVGSPREPAPGDDRAARLQAQRLEELHDAHRAAVQAGDSIVQQLTAARWMLEAGNSEGALAALEETVTQGITEVSSALPPLRPGPPTPDAEGPSPGD